MCKLIIGSMLIFFPLSISMLSTIVGAEYFWYFDDNHQRYDLIHSVISFSLIMTGCYLVLDNYKKMFIYFHTMVFIFYQIIASSFSLPRYEALLELSPTSKAAMISYDFGALSSKTHANLEIFESRSLFFLTSHAVASFDNVAIAKLSQLNQDTVLVEYTNFNQEDFVQEIKLQKKR